MSISFKNKIEYLYIMHETIIADRIIDEVKRFDKVKILYLELGDLCNITKDELENALIDRVNCNIKIKLRDSKIECGCGYTGKARIIERDHGYCLFNCPRCGNKPKVLDGGEIKILGVE